MSADVTWHTLNHFYFFIIECPYFTLILISMTLVRNTSCAWANQLNPDCHFIPHLVLSSWEGKGCQLMGQVHVWIDIHANPTYSNSPTIGCPPKDGPQRSFCTFFKLPITSWFIEIKCCIKRSA